MRQLITLGTSLIAIGVGVLAGTLATAIIVVVGWGHLYVR